MDVAQAAKDIARASKLPEDGRHPMDELTEFDRDILRFGTVQIRIPLRGVQECRQHLSMLANTAIELQALLERATEKDRTILLAVQQRLKRLSQKLNAYRTGGRA